MIVTYDVLDSASLGTGTTKTQINGALSKEIQGSINAILSLGGFHASTGATTAAQTYKPVIFLESQDISPNIDPIHYPMAGQAGGLGVTTAGMIPSLDVIPVNIRCKPGQRVKGFGQYLTANTVAGRLGIAMKQSSGGVPSGKRRAHWEVAGDPTGTALGTAAATVDGSNITITDADQVVEALVRVYPTTVTASEDFIGVANFTSSNWESEELHFPFQPIGSALGALITVGDLSSADMRYRPVLRSFKKTAGQFLIQNSVTVDEAQTGNGTFINGVAFTRPGE